MKKFIIHKLPELEAVALAVMKELLDLPAGSEHATVITLEGELGAGKTTFIQTLGQKLGVVDVMPSPTFGIMKSYHLDHSKFSRLVHMDAYRLESIEELRPLRFEELLRSVDTLLCIEWAERISEALPKERLALSFVSEPEGVRQIVMRSTFQNVGG